MAIATPMFIDKLFWHRTWEWLRIAIYGLTTVYTFRMILYIRWLFNRGPYFMVYWNNPHIPGEDFIPYVKQPTKVFFIAHFMASKSSTNHVQGTKPPCRSHRIQRPGGQFSQIFRKEKQIRILRNDDFGLERFSLEMTPSPWNHLKSLGRHTQRPIFCQKFERLIGTF